MDNQNQPIIESDSLETTDAPATPGVISPAAPVSAAPIENGVVIPNQPMSSNQAPKESLIRRILGRINLYFALLFVVFLTLGGVAYFAYTQNRESVTNTTINTEKLTQDTLEKLADTDATVGDPKQTLSIESNAIFSGSILVRGNIDVAGTVKVGGPLSLPGLNVGGTTTLDQAALKSLTVAGDATIQGKLTAQNGLSVTGGASFSGAVSAPQITIGTLQLNSDIQLNRHINAGGGAPSKTNGGALGGGGTASNSGTDTAGTVTINTGGGAPAGCFVTLTFAASFSVTPHVVISPASSSAAGLSYYVNRSTTSFSICTASDPPDSTAGIVFDYIAID
jgi:cytoskeletal protein CcmA (bactofilin family)